jgi:hypothetical protein
VSDYLVAFGHPMDETARKKVYDYMSHADGVMACCHITASVFGVRTEESHAELFSRLQDFIGSELAMVVAPLSGAWSSQNAITAFRCFRPRDDN